MKYFLYQLNPLNWPPVPVASKTFLIISFWKSFRKITMPRLPIKLKVALGSQYRFGIKVSVKRNRETNGGTTRNQSEGLVNDVTATEKPYVGQFWPLHPTMTGPGKNEPKVIVVVLGDRTDTSSTNDQESCYTDEPNEFHTPNTVPCLPERSNLMEENCSRRDGCASNREKPGAINQHFLLDECASTTPAHFNEKLPSGHNTAQGKLDSYSFERGRSTSRHRFKSSTETPLTEEEISALELDIIEPLDFLGILINRMMKRSCEQQTTEQRF